MKNRIFSGAPSEDFAGYAKAVIDGTTIYVSGTMGQDPATGAWPSVSMNKVYPEGSIQRQFMTHAATGYAAAALIACGRM